MLDKVVDLEGVVPYFQPIISVDRQRIVGYEILGRKQTRSGVESLGQFFHDPDVPDEDKAVVDRHIRQLALGHFRDPSADGMMAFINVNPNWTDWTLEHPERWSMIPLLVESGIAPDRVVIEITEQQFKGPVDRLRDLVEYYRGHGCRIALDDVGAGFSQLDRIALLHPDILKVDMQLVKNSTQHVSYFQLLQALSVIAANIGAMLLIEGVETERELQVGLDLGAGQMQGYLFSEALPGLQPPDSYAAMMKQALDAHRSHASLLASQRLAVVEELNTRMSAWVATQAEELDGAGSERCQVDRVLGTLLQRLPVCCSRVYLCDAMGNQLSSNIERAETEWVPDPAYFGANWSARPYFAYTTDLAFRVGTGMLSDTYPDVRSRQMMATFVFPVAGRLLIFADFLVSDLDRALADPNEAKRCLESS